MLLKLYKYLSVLEMSQEPQFLVLCCRNAKQNLRHLPDNSRRTACAGKELDGRKLYFICEEDKEQKKERRLQCREDILDLGTGDG